MLRQRKCFKKPISLPKHFLLQRQPGRPILPTSFFYLDLPVKDGKLQPQVLQKGDANRPLNSLDLYIYNIRQLKAIGFDAGDKDAGIAESIKTLDKKLNKYGIQHSFEIYEGDHINRVAKRIESKMLPFFAENLSFEQNTKGLTEATEEIFIA